MTSPSVVSLKVSDVPSNRASVEMSGGVGGQHVRIVTSQTSNLEKLTREMPLKIRTGTKIEIYGLQAIKIRTLRDAAYVLQ